MPQWWDKLLGLRNKASKEPLDILIWELEVTKTENEAVHERLRDELCGKGHDARMSEELCGKNGGIPEPSPGNILQSSAADFIVALCGNSDSLDVIDAINSRNREACSKLIIYIDKREHAMIGHSFSAESWQHLEASCAKIFEHNGLPDSDCNFSELYDWLQKLRVAKFLKRLESESDGI